MGGDPTAFPEYEAFVMRRDAGAKDERSRRRLHVVIGLAMAGTLVAGSVRFVRSMGVSKSYNYVQTSLLRHATVREALGSRAMVQSSTGTFKPSFVNAKLRLVGDGSAVADVKFSAIRDGGGRNPWRVALARITHDGRTYDLDRAQF